MGCFSFICKECGKGIRSTSFSGEQCKLFLLHEGKVIQQMEGQYDSYGRCFIEGSQRKDVKHELKESQAWNNPFPDKKPTENEEYFIKKGDDHWIWLRVWNLTDSRSQQGSGIAAVHTKCFKEVPTTKSANDPNQGWGEGTDEEECLMGNTDPDYAYD